LFAVKKSQTIWKPNTTLKMAHLLTLGNAQLSGMQLRPAPKRTRRQMELRDEQQQSKQARSSGLSRSEDVNEHRERRLIATEDDHRSWDRESSAEIEQRQREDLQWLKESDFALASPQADGDPGDEDGH
jgi:hypothetical protein